MDVHISARKEGQQLMPSLMDPKKSLPLNNETVGAILN